MLSFTPDAALAGAHTLYVQNVMPPGTGGERLAYDGG